MIQVLFRKFCVGSFVSEVLFRPVSDVLFCFLRWTVLLMITSDSAVDDTLRHSAADYTVGAQHRDSQA